MLHWIFIYLQMEKLTCRDRLPAYMSNIVMMLLMVRQTDSLHPWWFTVVPWWYVVSLTALFLHLWSCKQISVTFAIVFGVILYRISTKTALHMSSNPITRSHVQLTVKTTAAIINLVVILILDEVYGAVARWLTVLGKFRWRSGSSS